MAAVMDESEAAGPKSDATIKSRQRWRRVASIVISIQRRRWTMALEGVGDVRWRSTETAMVRQGGSETAKIELKRRMAEGGWPKADGRRRMSDGGIGGGRYCRRRPPSSIGNVTQQSNRGDGGGGWQQKSSPFNGGDGRVGDVRWRLTEMAMVRRGGSETTARIELKRWMADGGCQTWYQQ